MREILFRGKRIHGGDWVEGSLLQWPDGDASICFPGDRPETMDQYFVDPATVGQYTGLTDRNGRKIFEGAGQSADVAPVRRGRWSLDGQCSACGTFDNVDPYGSRYCPNCGAKMDEDRIELKPCPFLRRCVR